MKNLEMARNKIKDKASPELIKKDRTPFFIIGAGFLALIILFILNFPKADDSANSEKIRQIDTRLRQIENRLNRIESNEKRISSIDEQRTKFEISLMNRLDSMEALITLKRESNVVKQDTLHKEAIVKKVAKKEVLKESIKKESKIRHHQIRAGETLYRISIKYGMTVEELRKLNNIGPEAVIYVDQQLIISRDK
ncbi:LysM peptidoglycan-binding domain-containing protein [Thermodesulfobacteriota bacterium]